jgi:uncharacterized protein YkwD
MQRSARFVLALLFGAVAPTVHPAKRVMAASFGVAGINPFTAQTQHATVKPASVTAPDIPFNSAAQPYEAQAQDELLQLANSARRAAGAPPLMLDPGLSHAARVHAQAMVDAHQLSHQFKGEASLPVRLAATTDLQLDEEGENVAVDYDAQHGHESLMNSPPHRANLLNSAFNAVGLAVVQSGDRIYIVQDFGRAVPSYSPNDLKARVAAVVSQTRRQSRQAELQRQDLSTADAAACSMAQADRLGTAPVRELARRYSVLSYTSLHPETLPDGAAHAIAERGLRNFSVGVCYARTNTYPTGMYWIVLTLD